MSVLLQLRNEIVYKEGLMDFNFFSSYFPGRATRQPGRRHSKLLNSFDRLTCHQGDLKRKQTKFMCWETKRKSDQLERADWSPRIELFASSWKSKKNVCELIKLSQSSLSAAINSRLWLDLLRNETSTTLPNLFFTRPHAAYVSGLSESLSEN